MNLKIYVVKIKDLNKKLYIIYIGMIYVEIISIFRFKDVKLF